MTLPLFCGWRNSEAKIHRLFWIREVQCQKLSCFFWLRELRTCLVSLLEQKAAVKWESRAWAIDCLLWSSQSRAQAISWQQGRGSSGAHSTTVPVRSSQRTALSNVRVQFIHILLLGKMFPQWASHFYNWCFMEPILKWNIRINNKNRNPELLERVNTGQKWWFCTWRIQVEFFYHYLVVKFCW